MKKEHLSAANNFSKNGYGPIIFNTKNHGDMVSIHVDLGKIIQYWNDHGWYQRSPNVTSYKHDLPFDIDVARMLRIIQALKTKIALPSVSIEIGHRNSICFPDGRHRIVALFQSGYTSVVATIKREYLSEISNGLGTLNPDKRVLQIPI